MENLECNSWGYAGIPIPDRWKRTFQEQLNIIQRYVCIMYSRTSKYMKVNEVWRFMFAQGNKDFELTQPTEAALEQRIRRAALLGEHIWRQYLVPSPDYPDPQQWGLSRSWDEETWRRHWSSLTCASKVCKHPKACRCNPHRGCTNKCWCKRAAVVLYGSPCTDACLCKGGCE